MKFTPHTYQLRGIEWIKGHERCALFWEMGLGKSVVTLTAVSELINELEATRCLVVAPKKVAESTWGYEACKWDHLRGLRVALIAGNTPQRLEALNTDADVYVIGRDLFVWLCQHYRFRSFPFDMVVLDELTSFKSPASQRFKAFRKVLPFIHRVVGLTGTPTPNGLLDLWAQIYCLDEGERLGRSVVRYRDTYFDQHRWNNIVVRCSLKKGAEDIIRRKVADICLTMQAKDYLTLPPLRVHDIMVTLPAKTMTRYKDFEREMVLDFGTTMADTPIIAQSAAALMNKLSQMANGAIYDEEHNVHIEHDEKVTRLIELIEEAASPVLVFYQYKSDCDRLLGTLKKLRVAKYRNGEDLTRWNNGEYDVLLAHPASTAYGLNMQQGGHYVVWFGTGWDLELYQQANARLYRQGQTHPVTIYRLLCPGTVDMRAAAALDSKRTQQQALMDGLKELLHTYTHE